MFNYIPSTEKSWNTKAPALGSVHLKSVGGAGKRGGGGHANSVLDLGGGGEVNSALDLEGHVNSAYLETSLWSYISESLFIY